jgi:pimeloyl-ACP methyl ester carboxylesterase
MNLRLLMLGLVLASPAFAEFLPAPGPKLAPDDRKQLLAGVDALGKQIESLRNELKDRPNLMELLPDVEIFHKAVRFPLEYDEICDVGKARRALDTGMKRAELLREGKTPWTTDGGVRAYRSWIDGSVQPYMLAVPRNYHPAAALQYRVDIFCHGRDEKLSDLNFISAKPPAAAEDHFVIHPYGRYCVANKFAGEMDLFEILESMKKQYPIDENRIVLTGFSMGGAAVWHLAAHYPDKWVAASPGAGFAETRQYQNINVNSPTAPPWYEQRLWHFYDATDYARNLANFPLIAYHGELDKQKQSSDVMEAALAAEGLKLQRIIGPGVAHKYEDKAKAELDRRLAEYARQGRNPVPAEIHFTTYTLRYFRAFWIRVEGLEQHWQRADIDAKLLPDGIEAKTRNITALTFRFDQGKPFAAGSHPLVTIDGQKVQLPQVPNRRWETTLARRNDKWQIQTNPPQALRKRPGLQGPIDDAFMDRFIFVVPTGKTSNSQHEKWTTSELLRAQQQWRGLFRGEVQLKRDTDLSDQDVETSNLILWGDPASNKLLATIADRLPIRWTEKEIQLGDQKFDAAHHSLQLIYPNPLNPSKYIVLNSGHTFREDHNRTNSQQTPKLPDYAIIDLNTPPNGKAPGKVVAAGFFDENWQLSKDAPHE